MGHSETNNQDGASVSESAALEGLFFTAVVRGIGGLLFLALAVGAAIVVSVLKAAVWDWMSTYVEPLIGGFAISLLVLYVGCAVVYWMASGDSSQHRHLSAAEMPVLKPIPIPTKKRSALLRILIWIFSVRQWEVAENWTYTHSDGTTFVVPKGFRFDGASVPRFCWALLHPAGLLLVSGLIHDYAYRHAMLWRVVAGTENEVEEYGGLTRRAADCLFWQVGEDVNGVRTVNGLAFLAVSVGARGVWRKHREVNAQPSVPPGFRKRTEE